MNESPAATPAKTESLCPVCLRRVPALRIAERDAAFLEKHCPEHGPFRTVIWRGHPALKDWCRPKIPATPPFPAASVDKGCPFDCGLCPDHRQHTCTALLEVTRRCNLHCRYCFAESGPEPKFDPKPDPDLKTIRLWYQQVQAAGGRCNIQLSGGEPTVRNDLPDLIETGREAGFRFIQLNTNGLRIARESGYARQLKNAGLASVFLQFDGITDDTCIALRGRPLVDIKKQAVERCAQAGLGVVLVPTLIPGVNTDEIGGILKYAISGAPTVRGVHFQPVSYFGRYPRNPSDSDRLTLPEIMTALETQTEGMVRAGHFQPPGCENVLCSFHGNYIITEDGGLKPLSGENRSCRSAPEPAEAGARRTISAVARKWTSPLGSPSAKPSPGVAPEPISGCDSSHDCGTLDSFLERARTHAFGISAMAFQDAWTLDLERLRDCCIHVATPDGRMIPFCAYNLTNRTGQPLYRT